MTYRELLARLTDLRALAQMAPDGERSGCMSSYDRASRFDTATGTYVDWDANADGSGQRRAEAGSLGLGYRREFFPRYVGLDLCP